MPDFFGRLAGRAAELPSTGPILRPRLPQLFERPQPAPAEPPEPPTIQRHTAPTPPAPVAAQPPLPALTLPVTPEPTPARSTETVVERHTLTTVESVTETQRVAQLLNLPPTPALLPPPIVARTEAITPQPADHEPVDAPEPRPQPVIAPPPTQTTAIIRPDLPAVRRRPVERERVVRINIGRLEVRGGRAEPRHPAGSQRPEPAVGLADYLAREADRG